MGRGMGHASHRWASRPAFGGHWAGNRGGWPDFRRSEGRSGWNDGPSHRHRDGRGRGESGERRRSWDDAPRRDRDDEDRREKSEKEEDKTEEKQETESDDVTTSDDQLSRDLQWIWSLLVQKD